MLIRDHTILFTEACPLNCKYCYIQTDPIYGSAKQVTLEDIIAFIEKIKEKDSQDKNIKTQLTFTGGEPFLYWDWIKIIMEKYGNDFNYSFNTSGYCFTEEILQFLSKFDSVSFVLSIDGTEKLTNYLRPVKENPYKVGYYKKLKEIIPTLLYYFPSTPYRIIVNQRYVDLLHECYLDAQRLGFKYFTFLLDLRTRPEELRSGEKPWSEESSKILQEQMNLICLEIIEGFKDGVDKPQIVEINKIINFLFNKKPYSPDNLPCQLFAERDLTSAYDNMSKTDNCMGSTYPNLKDAYQDLIKAYNEQNGKCKLDKNCPVFEYCANYCCPKNSLEFRGGFFNFDILECTVNKICYNSAIKILQACNIYCPESKLYTRFLNRFNYEEKEEVLVPWEQTFVDSL